MFVSPAVALVFLRQGLLLSLGFAGWLDRLSSKPLGFLCTMIIGTAAMHGFLRGFWGSELRPLCLLSKHFINRSSP